LALTREAARLLDGRIEVESRPDQGSSFTLIVELPKENLEM
jgi:signal transduction histidine kinase